MATNEDIYSTLIRRIANVQQNYNLGELNPFGIGGMARFFTTAQDVVELVQACKAAYDAELPFFVIGQGRSTLFEGEFTGLVIQNRAAEVAFSKEQSQVVVDSGTSVQNLVMSAVGRGFGGLLPFYPIGGTIGSACFYNWMADGQPFSDLVRSITLLVPPTRIKPEANIIRHRATWLVGKEQPGRLAEWRQQRGVAEYLPVILSVQIQLTSVRPDELARRLQREVHLYRQNRPPDEAWIGPLFLESPEFSLRDLFIKGDIFRLRHHGLFIDRRYPNYLRYKRPRRSDEVATAADLALLLDEINERVATRTGVTLTRMVEVIALPREDGEVPSV